jgi:hypothetical protein
MKILFSVLFLLFISICNSYGQWYVKKYQVANINLLSKKQLEESLVDSKKSLAASGIITGMGGVMCLISKYSSWAPDENPTLIQQLMGEKWKKTSATIVGAGLLAGGTIACIVYFARIGKIRTAIHKNYPATGSWKITPNIFSNQYTSTYPGGITLTYSF